MEKKTHNKATVTGGVGGAIGFLVVLFMPETWHVFTPETAAAAAAAFGIFFTYLSRWIPDPE